jgi:DNA topoisomerase IB
VIPPAWRDVWISPYPNGHLQVVGSDDRGRRQYMYHQQWQEMRGRQKHERIIDFARRLPAARDRVAEHLALPGMPRERVLAAAFRLLDLGLFRIGGELYAEENGSHGLATLRKEHVTIEGGTAVFSFLAKSGVQQEVTIADPDVVAVLQILKRRRRGGVELLAWQRDDRRWIDVTSADINEYVKDVVGKKFSAKDFRTWHGTVLAAVALAAVPEPGSATAARRGVTRAMKEVAEQLGNTPAVCRGSYVNPAVIERFHQGSTIRTAVQRARRAPGAPDAAVSAAAERAVLRLLRE